METIEVKHFGSIM